MSYDPNIPGVHESVLIAIRDRLVQKLPDLNIALTRTPVVVTTTITSGMVMIGNSELLPEYPVSIFVSCPEDDISYEQDMEFIDVGNGFRATISTDIMIYLHPDLIRTDSKSTGAYITNITLTRLADWARSCFTGQNVSLTLQSSEFCSPNDVAHGFIEAVGIYLEQKGAAGSIYAPTVQLVHVCTVP